MTIKIRKDSYFINLLKDKLKAHYEARRRVDDIIHVSDILPSNCLRKQYYTRRLPELDIITDSTVQHFIRGEASEYVITKLSDAGFAQAELKLDELVAHPDIMDKEIVIELKDTTSHKRLDINDEKFKSYVRQLLYYLTISEIEKGIICIRYSNENLKFIKKDEEGDYFFRPNNTNKQEIESWSVFLPKNDVIREILKNEMIRRKNLFLRALKEDDVAILPRLTGPRNIMCEWCRYYTNCMQTDGETDEAKEMAKELDLLDINDTIDFKPILDDNEIE